MDNHFSLLVDSSIYIFRAWHTWSDSIRDPSGQPINAVHGFAEFIYELLATHRPRHIAFAFDETRDESHRRALFPDYKANRPPSPPELRHQFGLCRQFVDALGLNMLSLRGYEADDVIGTLARSERTQGRRIALITGDKDLAQLVCDGDIWWDYARNRQLDSKGVEQFFGVRPELIADLLALAGDKIDNIPGIPGVGMATAARLLRPFGSLDDLLSDIPRIGRLKLRGAVRFMRLVEEHQETVRLSRKLTGIDCEAPLDPSRSIKPGLVNRDRLEHCFTDLSFSSFQRKRWWQLLTDWQNDRVPAG